MKVLVIWIAASLLLLIALVLRGWIEEFQAKLKVWRRRRLEEGASYSERPAGDDEVR
jgi:hypothetical protein